jgi:branched-chain amino acid transport system permease protein
VSGPLGLGPGGVVAPPVSSLRAYLPIVVASVVLALVPLSLGGSRYFLSLGVHLLVVASYAVAFNLVFGSTSQLFLCQGALAGAAAYCSVILGNRYGLPLWLTIPAGVGLAALLGGGLSWVAVSRRLEVIYLGIVTLAFSLVFTNLLLGGRELTGGETGLVVDGGAGTWLRSPATAYYLFLALLVGHLVVYRAIERSRLGWGFRALRDDEVAAALAGVDVARAKVTAGVVGAAMLGSVGATFAAHEGFVSPTTFAFGEVDVRVLVVLALGGVGTLLGPVVGAVVVTVVDELLRPLGQLRLTVYGVVLVVIFLGFRQGMVRSVRSLWMRAGTRAGPRAGPRAGTRPRTD